MAVAVAVAVTAPTWSTPPMSTPRASVAAVALTAPEASWRTSTDADVQPTEAVALATPPAAEADEAFGSVLLASATGP